VQTPKSAKFDRMEIIIVQLLYSQVNVRGNGWNIVIFRASRPEGRAFYMLFYLYSSEVLYQKEESRFSSGQR